MIRSRVLLSAVAAGLAVALAGCQDTGAYVYPNAGYGDGYGYGYGYGYPYYGGGYYGGG